MALANGRSAVLVRGSRRDNFGQVRFRSPPGGRYDRPAPRRCAMRTPGIQGAVRERYRAGWFHERVRDHHTCSGGSRMAETAIDRRCKVFSCVWRTVLSSSSAPSGAPRPFSGSIRDSPQRRRDQPKCCAAMRAKNRHKFCMLPYQALTGVARVIGSVCQSNELHGVFQEFERHPAYTWKCRSTAADRSGGYGPGLQANPTALYRAPGHSEAAETQLAPGPQVHTRCCRRDWN